MGAFWGFSGIRVFSMVACVSGLGYNSGGQIFRVLGWTLGFVKLLCWGGLRLWWFGGLLWLIIVIPSDLRVGWGLI